MQSATADGVRAPVHDRDRRARPLRAAASGSGNAGRPGPPRSPSTRGTARGRRSRSGTAAGARPTGSSSCWPHAHRHQPPVRSDVEELGSVGAPARLVAALRGDPPALARLREGRHVDLPLPGLVGGVGQATGRPARSRRTAGSPAHRRGRGLLRSRGRAGRASARGRGRRRLAAVDDLSAAPAQWRRERSGRPFVGSGSGAVPLPRRVTHRPLTEPRCMPSSPRVASSEKAAVMASPAAVTCRAVAVAMS